MSEPRRSIPIPNPPKGVGAFLFNGLRILRTRPVLARRAAVLEAWHRHGFRLSPAATASTLRCCITNRFALLDILERQPGRRSAYDTSSRALVFTFGCAGRLEPRRAKQAHQTRLSRETACNFERRRSHRGEHGSARAVTSWKLLPSRCGKALGARLRATVPAQSGRISFAHIGWLKRMPHATILSTLDVQF